MLKMLKELPAILKDEGLSLMVHSEGSRAYQCGKPVKLLSAVFVDFAIQAGLPIVPVRFSV
jgi:hypothetical protein